MSTHTRSSNLKPRDVLFGRGSGANDYIGNKYFRWIVEQRKDEYQRSSRRQKQQIARQILQVVQDEGGRFLQKMAGMDLFEEVAEPKVISKCLHALREKTSAPPFPHTHLSEAPESNNDKNTEEKQGCQQFLEDAAACVLDSFQDEQKESISDDDFSALSGTTETSHRHPVDLELSVRTAKGHLRISPSEEQMERKLLSQQEQEEVLIDIFGKFCTLHPEKRIKHTKDKQYISCAIEMMRQEMELLPPEQKLILSEAQEKSGCPKEEFGDARLEQFLRSVDWYPKRAAERFAMYWENRKQLFGPEKYCLPMTLAGALRDDLTALRTGFVCLLPRPDMSGRLLQFFMMSNHTKKGYSKESLVRASWYVTEVAIRQDSEYNGLVRFACGQDASLCNIDQDVISPIQSYKKDCWPIKVMADHTICCSQECLDFLLPASRYSKGKEGRLRSVVHDVPVGELFEVLGGYGISKDMLPKEVGGSIEFSVDDWIAARRNAELKEGANFPSKLEGHGDKETASCFDEVNKMNAAHLCFGHELLDDLLNEETHKSIDELGELLAHGPSAFFE